MTRTEPERLGWEHGCDVVNRPRGRYVDVMLAVWLARTQAWSGVAPMRQGEPRGVGVGLRWERRRNDWGLP
jgi:hypothetical protein